MYESMQLQWDNLNYTVKQKVFNWRRFKSEESELHILKDANGIVKSGELVAILGSSGSGKTTLLAAISQRIRGNVTGNVLINQRPISRKQMILRSSFVPQFDIAIDSLTVREHLYFMCELRVDRRVSKFQKNDRINDTLWKLGLMKVADCRIATLSGGERKSLNLATEVLINEFNSELEMSELPKNVIENRTESELSGFKILIGPGSSRLKGYLSSLIIITLLTDPQIVFCDEITTGLDSYNALNVIRSLQLLAHKNLPPAIPTEEATKCDQKNLLDAIEMGIVDQTRTLPNKVIICSIHQPTSEVFECFSHVILMQSGRICFQGTVDQARSFFCGYGFHCPLMCNPAEFFINVMSKNKIFGENDKTERKWFPRVLRDDQQNEIPNIELDRVRWIYQVFILLKRKSLESKRTVKQHFIESLTYLITAVSIGLLFAAVQPNDQQSIQSINGFVFTLAAEIIFGTSYGIIYYYPSTLPILRRETGENIYDLSAFYIAKFIGCIPKSFLNAYGFLLIVYANVHFIQDFWHFLQIGFTLSMTAIPATAYGLMLSGVFDTVRLSSELSPPIDIFMFLISGFYIKLKLLWFLQYISLFFFSIEALSIQIWKRISVIDCNPNSYEFCFNNGTEVLEMLSYNTDDNWVYIDYCGLLGIATVMHLIGYMGVRRMVNKSGYY